MSGGLLVVIPQECNRWIGVNGGRENKHATIIAVQCPHSLRETNFKENNAISHLTDDNIILYPLLPSDTLDQ